MGDICANIAKGKVAYYAGLPAANDALIAVLFKSSGLVTDAALADYDDLAAVLAGATDECDFTGYARKTLSTVTVTVDDASDRVDIDCDDITWSTAGGAANNTIGKLGVFYDPDTTAGTDADLIPLTYHDVSATTDGTSLLVMIPSGGFARAT